MLADEYNVRTFSGEQTFETACDLSACGPLYQVISLR